MIVSLLEKFKEGIKKSAAESLAKSGHSFSSLDETHSSFPDHLVLSSSNRFRKVTFLIIQLEVTELSLLSLWLTCTCPKQSLLLSVLCNLIRHSRTNTRPLEKVGWSLNVSWDTGTENKSGAHSPRQSVNCFLNGG